MNLREKLIETVETSSNQIKVGIAKQLINCFNEETYISINQLAEKTFTSKSTISKFCIKLGFTGYKELLSKLKFERQNYSNVYLGSINKTNFKQIKTNFINNINYFDKYEHEVSKITEYLNDVKIHIISASQMQSCANMLEMLLLYKNKNVTNLPYIVPNMNIDLKLKNQTIIIFASGIDIAHIVRVYNLIKANNNVILFCSYALSSRFGETVVKIIIDPIEDSTPLFERLALVNYLIAQIYNQIE